MMNQSTINSKYQLVIGLEVHVELYTKSKMFCSCSADYFGKKPNTHTCPVCLGLPGALPVPNLQAMAWCVQIGFALNCKIPLFAKFDRKNYFYPDLAKGYQISQYDEPFCLEGSMVLSNGKKIGITRAHMEEDTGKLTHATVDGKKVSLVDFNRSGVPLVEIVTEPDFENAQEVVEYLKRLHQVVRYLEVSNADMEKGDMRLEPNISLRKPGEKKLPPYKVEVKNINSFKFVEKAINFEYARQAEILDRGEIPTQETRGWNDAKGETFSQRSKEEAQDYRYFPEPDIPPIRWMEDEIFQIKAKVPELPTDKQKRFQKEYSLSTYDVEILTRERDMANYFEEAVKAGKKAGLTPKQIANLIINEKPDITSILPAALIKQQVSSGHKITIVEDELKEKVESVISQNPDAVESYKMGKVNVIMFLVGQVQKETQGKSDPSSVKSMLEEKLHG